MKALPEDFSELFKLVNSEFVGYEDRLSHYLYRAIYSLHFVDEGDVPKNAVREISFTLYQLSECFYRAEERYHLRELNRLRDAVVEAHLLSDKPG
ncbi:hypothetical protein FNH22_31385 [Fulvivirga sp. M361]|uniref:hypothetical protein n=1 Tax=Fulvivirga sp. M361 TaxID=2594266 RepID=UPI00117B1716|nr:hypothetical protein [Fulvivirga sp. M361]TRX45808.1 hypothetical protein FNH22_31385 [Fulvivirga sp. M361]